MKKLFKVPNGIIYYININDANYINSNDAKENDNRKIKYIFLYKNNLIEGIALFISKYIK